MLKTIGNELYFYDVIGPSNWGYIGADEVVEELSKRQGQKVIARINSPGGSVDEGIAIFNALRRHDGGVEVVVDSMAASIASVIAMAGKKVTMAVGSRMMIHDPWTIAAGNAKQLRKQAEVLEKYRDGIIETYNTRSKKTKEEIIEIMDAETWLSADEAIQGGFADIVEGTAIESPMIPENVFKHVPMDLITSPMATTRYRKAVAAQFRMTRAQHGI